MRGLHYALIALAMKLGTAAAALVNYQRFCNLKTQLFGAPEEALQDIVIPNILPADFNDEDTRLWVPQTDCLSFRPLCLCVSQGYYVNLLKFKGGGMLSRHRHSSPVHALTIKGNWRCKHKLVENSETFLRLILLLSSISELPLWFLVLPYVKLLFIFRCGALLASISWDIRFRASG
jgi:hypothetical protein